jgi:putative membrane protein
MLNFLAYVGVALALWGVGIFLMEITTKNKEWELIKNGNKTAAYVFLGRIVGLAIVLFSAVSNSISLLDLLIWGAIGIIAQIIFFYLAEWLTPKFNITKAIDDNIESVGILLMGLSISIGIIIAGCLTY